MNFIVGDAGSCGGLEWCKQELVDGSKFDTSICTWILFILGFLVLITIKVSWNT